MAKPKKTAKPHPISQKRQEWERTRFADVLGDYLIGRRLAKRTPRTLEHIRQRVGPFLVWLDGLYANSPQNVLTLEDLRAAHIRAYLVTLEERGLAPATQASEYAHIRAFLRWCAREYDWARDPTRNIEAPKLDREPKPVLSEADFDRLLRQAKLDGGLLGARRAAMLWVLLSTGMRVGELAALTLADYTPETGTLHIAAGHSKSRKARDVDLSDEAHLALRAYLRARGRDRCPALWVTRGHRALAAKRWGPAHDLAMLYRAAGVPAHDVAHIFRRNATVAAVKAGTPAGYIQRVLGWSTPAMVARYGEPVSQEVEAAREAMRSVAPWGQGQGRKQ